MASIEFSTSYGPAHFNQDTGMWEQSVSTVDQNGNVHGEPQTYTATTFNGLPGNAPDYGLDEKGAKLGGRIGGIVGGKIGSRLGKEGAIIGSQLGRHAGKGIGYYAGIAADPVGRTAAQTANMISEEMGLSHPGANAIRDADPFGGGISDKDLAWFYSDDEFAPTDPLGGGTAPENYGVDGVINDYFGESYLEDTTDSASPLGISDTDPGALMGNTGNDTLNEVANAALVGFTNTGPTSLGAKAGNQTAYTALTVDPAEQAAHAERATAMVMGATTDIGAAYRGAHSTSGNPGNSIYGNSPTTAGPSAGKADTSGEKTNYGVEPVSFVDAFTAAHNYTMDTDPANAGASNSVNFLGEQTANIGDNLLGAESNIASGYAVDGTYNGGWGVGASGPNGSALSSGMFSNGDMSGGAYAGGDYGYGYGVDSDGEWGSAYSDGTVDTMGGAIDAMGNDAETMGSGGSTGGGGNSGFTATATGAPMSGMSPDGVWGVETGDGGGAECFTGDTPILMADGSEKPIAEIKPGDLIASFSNLGEIKSELVLENIVSGRRRLINIDGVKATPPHPFLCANGKWIFAREIEPGIELVNADGSSHIVRQIYSDGEADNVYNLEVAGGDCFVAGGFRVHNSTIICAELHRQGWFSDEEWDIERKYSRYENPFRGFGEDWAEDTDCVSHTYRLIAKPLIALSRRAPMSFGRWLAAGIRPWITELGHRYADKPKGHILGRLAMDYGTPIIRFLIRRDPFDKLTPGGVAGEQRAGT